MSVDTGEGYGCEKCSDTSKIIVPATAGNGWHYEPCPECTPSELLEEAELLETRREH